MRWPLLERFLTIDETDVGCAEMFELLDRYVERELAYGDADAVFPAASVHLANCRPCLEDFDGLLAALVETLR